MRVDLVVPYADKDKVKRLGAKWDDAKRIWYVQDAENLWPFLKWMQDKHKKPVAKSVRKK